MSWTWLLVLLVPAGWCFTNRQYRQIYGARLRWPYFWASHGALLWRMRLPEWEQAPLPATPHPDCEST